MGKTESNINYLNYFGNDEYTILEKDEKFALCKIGSTEPLFDVWFDTLISWQGNNVLVSEDKIYYLISLTDGVLANCEYLSCYHLTPSTVCFERNLYKTYDIMFVKTGKTIIVSNFQIFEKANIFGCQMFAGIGCDAKTYFFDSTTGEDVTDTIIGRGDSIIFVSTQWDWGVLYLKTQEQSDTWGVMQLKSGIFVNVYNDINKINEDIAFYCNSGNISLIANNKKYNILYFEFINKNIGIVQVNSDNDLSKQRYILINLETKKVLYLTENGESLSKLGGTFEVIPDQWIVISDFCDGCRIKKIIDINGDTLLNFDNPVKNIYVWGNSHYIISDEDSVYVINTKGEKTGINISFNGRAESISFIPSIRQVKISLAKELGFNPDIINNCNCVSWLNEDMILVTKSHNNRCNILHRDGRLLYDEWFKDIYQIDGKLFSGIKGKLMVMRDFDGGKAILPNFYRYSHGIIRYPERQFTFNRDCCCMFESKTNDNYIIFSNGEIIKVKLKLETNNVIFSLTTPKVIFEDNDK